jgi:hypothetical protein
MTIERSAAMHRYRRTGAMLFAVVAAQLAAAIVNGAPGDGRGQLAVEGRWAYSRQAGPDDTTDMATTPATQDGDVWFLLACSGNGRLSVALIHMDRFPFELDETSSLQVQSARLSTVSVVAERLRPAQIVMDAALVQHIMPLLLDEQEVTVSVAARDGVVHRYTFALQPNVVALAPLRSRCLGD